jgi:hypothetical protein
MAANALFNCKQEGDIAKRMECLEKNIETLQSEAASNLVQMGSKTFGENRSGTPNWPFQGLPSERRNELDLASNPICTVICHKADGLHRDRWRSIWNQYRYGSVGVLG